MSTVTSCTLSNSGPVVRLANSGVGWFTSVAPAAIAPFSSKRRSRSLSVCCASNSKWDNNPKTELHPFSIPPYALVHPQPPPEGKEERWQIKEKTEGVELLFEVPGQSRDDLIVEIDVDVLVIKRTTASAPDGRVIYARLLIPAGYKRDGVEAKLESGVLMVSIAKIEEQARSKIRVPIDVSIRPCQTN